MTSDCVGGIIHHPELPGKTHQRMPNDVKKRQKCHENQQKKETKENAAVLAASHDFGSSLRSFSAASSGINAL